MHRSEKAALRRRIRAGLDPAARDAESPLICRHVLAWKCWREARIIGGYVPMRHEADITPLLEEALLSGKTLALPRCLAAPEMTFHAVHSLEELRPGAYGLPEPPPDAPVIPPQRLELLLVPLEAVTEHGLRLGKGGGYYDRFLSRTGALTLGIALRGQWTAELPADPWDKPLTACADARGIHMFIGSDQKGSC